MNAPRLSVIIVSRHRAGALARCIKGLAQQDTPFELIVVADEKGLRATDSYGVAIKRMGFDEPNISAARNIGLGMAAGDVVAFIDDDAVPEPTWAGRLLRAFDAPEVVAATGFVLGRNGISFQWQGAAIDTHGWDHPLAVTGLDAVVPKLGQGLAVKCQGTNMAFRSSALRAIGGFDPAFHFYLEDGDASLRIATRGATAIVAGALVHHGFLPSGQRRADRVPQTLFDIGASSAVFRRRHTGGAGELPRDLIAAQKRRLITHMVAGRIEPRDVTRLMHTLTEGWADGCTRPLTPLDPLSHDPDRFQPFPRSGEPVRTEFHLHAGFSPHWHRFTEDGIWVQSGGVWGRSIRDRRAPIFCSRSQRINLETTRISPYRPI